MRRQKFTARTIYLIGPVQLQTALALLPNLPLDETNPLELVIREKVKTRNLSQNALMWSGPLADMAQQCWIEKRQHSAEVWHELFKREFLPEEFDIELTKDGYEKWSIGPTGERYLIGSTTNLTVKGMAQYITNIFAFGSSYGVQFGTKESQFA